MKGIITDVITLLLLSFTVVAQQSLPEEIVFKIKREAFQHSQIESLAFFLTDFTGPRLPASRLGEQSEISVMEKLTALGFSNARIEKAADFPKGGWDNLKTYAAMTSPYYCNGFYLLFFYYLSNT